MKKLTEAERRMHLASCCRWKFDGYTIDEEGMPRDCTLVNEANPYLPGKVVMVPKRTCGQPRCFVPCDQDNFGNPSFDELWCEHCDIQLCSEWRFCPSCGAEVADD